MSKQAKQTEKLIGKLSLMAILFLTALPLMNVEASNNHTPEKKCERPQFSNEMSAYDTFLAIEPWMLIHTDWIKSEEDYGADYTVNIESWMLSPEDWGYDLAETVDMKLNIVFGWMLDPSGWGSDYTDLSYQTSYFDWRFSSFYF